MNIQIVTQTIHGRVVSQRIQDNFAARKFLLEVRPMMRKLLSFRRYPEFLCFLWWRTVTPFLLRRPGLEFSKSVQFLGQPIISLIPSSRITIDESVSLCSVSRFTDLGVNHPVIIRTLRAGAHIEIGADTGISGATICAAVNVTIGKQCLLGANVVVTDTDFHALKPENRRHNNRPEDIAAAPVKIGDNVFLGAGVIVLKGVSIGDNSVVGAGAIVTRSIPANSIAAGNPARVVGQIDL